MGKNNIELLKFAESFKGKGGSLFRSYCGLGSGQPWCCAYITYLFHKGGDSVFFYGGKKVVYCPNALSWCRANLAMVPLYMALPSDIIFFDWQPNGIPDHIGLVRERKSCDAIYTIEGNTSGGIVDYKTRPAKYVLGVYRPHFPATFDASEKLVIDGLAGYHTIAILQRALGVTVDGILGKGTVRALQKRAGTTQDGHWGNGTSRAVQKMLGVKADGLFGPDSVKALQKWCNNKVFPQQTIIDNEMDACKTQSVWMKNAAYKWESNPTIEKSKKKGTCVTYVACVLQRLGYLKPGEFIWQNGKGYGNGKVYGTNNKMTVTYMGNKSLSSLKSKLKTGDIILLDDNKSGEKGSGGHIFILAGWKGTTPIIWDNETAKKGQKARTYKGSRKVLAVVRLK